MYPIDVTRQGVASLEGWSSGQDSILGLIRCGGTGLPQASGLFVSLPFRRAIARLVPSVCGPWLLGREGFILDSVIISCIMPWQSSFPCHRMCCEPDTLLWFGLSVFRVADINGIVGHVSFLPPK